MFEAQVLVTQTNNGCRREWKSIKSRNLVYKFFKKELAQDMLDMFYKSVSKDEKRVIEVK